MPITDMSQEEALRLQDLKTNPQKFQQGGHGCCGTASALMALLKHAPQEVEALWTSLHHSTPFRKIAGSQEVSTKLVKRMSLDGLSEGKPNFLDVKLAIGLLIMAKDALKASGKTALWNECEAYSKLWDGWQHGEKLNLGNVLTAQFGYKHGDIALTNQVTKFVLELLGFTSVTVKDLISNDALMAEKAKLPGINTHADLTKEIKDLVTAINAGTHLGALVGIAKKAYLEPAKAVEAVKYGYVAHWVYLPKQAVQQNAFATKIWTWGSETTFQALLTDARNYVPRVAVAFKR